MEEPRSIAVIDVGATNAKFVHVAPDLSVLAERAMPVVRRDGPPYLSLDPEPLVAAAIEAIRGFDAARPVDAIIASTHGSALALLDAEGALTLPVMSYLAEVPPQVAAAYATIAPPFAEVLAPTNPGALTLGRQLLWQETGWPEAFARVTAIMPYAQFIAFRLTGTAASEVSALGAQTHLWAPLEGRFSSLARARGWDRRFPPLRHAGAVLGQARIAGLRGRAEVLCGVHDSNANFLRYAGQGPLVLLSTGTWIIAFDSGASVAALDGARDQVSNTTVDGTPVACARFMGGEEFARVAGPGNAARPGAAGVAALVARGTMALPAFTVSGGPLPETGGKGRIAGPPPSDAAERASLATLYSAQMTAIMLEALGGTARVVIDGPFAANPVFPELLAALLPGRALWRSHATQGTAAGAATLALTSPPPPELEPVAAADFPGLAGYHANWRTKAGA